MSARRDPALAWIGLLLLAGVLLLVIGWHLDTTGRSADERTGSILPTALGLLLLLGDAVLLIVWLVRKRRPAIKPPE